MPAYNVLTVEEAAHRLGVSPERVRQFCRENRLGKRLGDPERGRWVISEIDLRRFMRQPRPNGRPPNGRKKSPLQVSVA